MSKNITIQEGGNAKAMSNVAKLRTSLQGGGSCLWVPEDETQVTTKYITANGEYAAASDGYHGYSQVSVNVAGGAGSSEPGGIGSSLIGTDPIDGNDYMIGVDENGMLETTMVPSSIKIVTLPTKIDYREGENIDYSGIEVMLYDGNGDVFTDDKHPDGYALFEELVFPVNRADPDKLSGDEYTNGQGLNVLRMDYTQQSDDWWDGPTPPKSPPLSKLYPKEIGKSREGNPLTFGAPWMSAPIIDYKDKYGYVTQWFDPAYNTKIVYHLSETGYDYVDILEYRMADPDIAWEHGFGWHRRLDLPTHWSGGPFDHLSANPAISPGTPNPSSLKIEEWTGIPESTVDPMGAGQTIDTLYLIGASVPVQWSGGYSTLEDTFHIKVDH